MPFCDVTPLSTFQTFHMTRQSSPVSQMLRLDMRIGVFIISGLNLSFRRLMMSYIKYMCTAIFKEPRL